MKTVNSAARGGEHQRQRLACNPAVRQRLLEFLDARFGDLCSKKLQIFKLGQSFQVLQSSVGDVGAVEEQVLKLRQPLQML